MKILKSLILPIAALIIGSIFLLDPAASAQHESGMGYEDTPMLPGGKWHVHDAKRPQPVKVTAGMCRDEGRSVRPPSDAHVLFDGKDLSHWKDAHGSPAQWTVRDGYFEVAPKTGDIYTREEFGTSNSTSSGGLPRPSGREMYGRGIAEFFCLAFTSFKFSKAAAT